MSRPIKEARAAFQASDPVYGLWTSHDEENVQMGKQAESDFLG